jgi:DnaJ-class molecular chaperone
MNYYEILGLKPNASKNEIKKSYHKLAIQFHPDKTNNKNDQDKFKKISEAYSILYDNDKRKQYDLTGISDINLTDPLEMFQNIFNNFKPDNNFEFNVSGSYDISSMMFDTENIFNSNKMNEVLPDMFNTLTSVISGNENNIDNPIKTNLVKTFINVTKNIIDENLEQDKNNINSNKKYYYQKIDLDEKSNKNINNLDRNNNNIENNKKNINNKNKPDDIFITKEFSLKEFYNKKKKKFNYYRLENNNKIKDSVILDLILNEKIIIKNKGHYLKQYENRGDIIFLFTLKGEENNYIVEKNNIIIEKNIFPYDLYSKYKCDLLLPNENIFNLEIDDLFKTYYNYIIPNMGLSNIKGEIGNLIIKFNIIFNELSDENIKLLNEMFS